MKELKRSLREGGTDAMDLTAELKQFAARIGIDRIGIASVETFRAEAAQLRAQAEINRYPAFTEKDVSARTAPLQWMPEAKSLISIAVSYLTDDRARAPVGDGKPRAWVSRYAWGPVDYHHDLRDKLEQLIAFLQDMTGEEVKAVPFVDTGPPIDRSVAARAGVGWFGKNNCVYVPGYGSWVFLGEIVTNVELRPDEPIHRTCGTCDRCLCACPTGAITAPFRIDPTRCLSYITQMPGVIPREFRRPMGRMLFGCDICQVVCPWNWEAEPTNRPAYRPTPTLGSRPELIPLLEMTTGQFKRWFGGTAMAWRGKKIIQRNACICLGNIGDPQAIEPLRSRLENDAKPEVRGAAAWALGEIGGENAVRALEAAAASETSPMVLEEIELALATAAAKAASS